MARTSGATRVALALLSLLALALLVSVRMRSAGSTSAFDAAPRFLSCFWRNGTLTLVGIKRESARTAQNFYLGALQSKRVLYNPDEGVVVEFPNVLAPQSDAVLAVSLEPNSRGRSVLVANCTIARSQAIASNAGICLLTNRDANLARFMAYYREHVPNVTFYVYDNTPTQHLGALLASERDVDVVAWPSERDAAWTRLRAALPRLFYPHHLQKAQNLDCLYRYRGARYLFMIDDDEFVMPARDDYVLADVLDSYYAAHHRDAGGLAVRNNFCAFLDGSSTRYRCERYIYPHPERQKTLVFPQNVAYFSTHQILVGAPPLNVSEHILMMRHFKTAHRMGALSEETRVLD